MSICSLFPLFWILVGAYLQQLIIFWFKRDSRPLDLFCSGSEVMQLT